MWLEFFCWWCWVISIYSIQTGPVIKQQVFYIDDSLMKRPRDFNVPYAFLFSFAVSFQTFAVLLLQCFLCIFIEMITDNIDCLPDFLCKCVPLCFCIHHFFLSLNPRQRVIPLFSVRTLFFKSGPKWALPIS